jgi:lysophospholipase L1-like esterase
VAVTVYYDEDGSGAIDPGERVRFPEVEVEVAGRVARTERGTGRAVVSGVPAGSHAVSVRPETLPPFFEVSRSASVTVPPGAVEASLALTAPIGGNRPNTYLAFGDSLTVGEGARSSDGYRSILQDQLRQWLGAATVIDDGASGTRSGRGADRLGASLNRYRPAAVLVMYGTNDWNDNRCKVEFPCDTVENLRTMIGLAKSVRTLPFLATIPPANPEVAGEERNDWVARLNDLLRPMARQEGAVLVEVHQAFLREGPLPSLFVDHVHPNDRGYQIIANEFFRAISRRAP